VMTSYVLDIKRPIELMQALIEEYGDSDTFLRLVGDVTQLSSNSLDDVRVFSWPGSGDSFIAEIPLTDSNRAALVKSILPRVGIRRRVYGVIIVRGDRELFASCDNFYYWPMDKHHVYNKGAIISTEVSTSFLDELVERGVIRGYDVNPYDSAQ
jgi:hypothetical protein